MPGNYREDIEARTLSNPASQVVGKEAKAEGESSFGKCRRHLQEGQAVHPDLWRLSFEDTVVRSGAAWQELTWPE